MKPLRASALGVAVAFSLLAQDARADDPISRVDLEWHSAPGCPARDAIIRGMQDILRGSTAPSRRVQTRATVTLVNGAFHAELSVQTSEGEGRRSFNAQTCDEIADAVAVITAMAIDPEKAASAQERAEGAPPPATTAPPPAPQTSAPASDAPFAIPTEIRVVRIMSIEKPETLTPDTREASPREHLTLSVSTSAAADTGVMPSFAIGGSLAVAASFHRARIELHGELWSDQHAANPPRPTETVPLSFVSGGARVCYSVLEQSVGAIGVSLSPCATFDVGQMSGTGIGGLSGGGGLYDAAGGGALARVALTSAFSIRVDGSVLAALATPRFVALASDGTVSNEVFRSASIGGRFGVGAEMRFF